MTREEAIADIRDNIKPIVGGKSLDMAIKALTAISELSKSLKAVNRYEMDKKVLIGFNMAVAIFNKCFGEIGEMSEQMPSYNSIKTELNGDLIHRKDVITMLNKIENAVEDGDGFQFNEWAGYVKELPTYSAEKPIKHFGAIECPNCGRLLMLEEQTYDWCKGCKEYDTEKHCCHRYSSFIQESLKENINAVLEDIKAEFIKRYPHNYCGEPELGGVSCVFSLNEVLEIIDKHISENAPTVEKQPTAKWEWVQYESLPDFGNYHCSNCRHIEHKIDGYKYCPNCGAKMKGGVE